LPHAAAKATKAAAPETAEAATAASRRIAGTVLTREASWSPFAKELLERKAPLWACRGFEFRGSNNTERVFRAALMAD
jgi:hypothetical protein